MKPIPLPRGFRVEQQGDTCTWTRRWALATPNIWVMYLVATCFAAGGVFTMVTSDGGNWGNNLFAAFSFLMVLLAVYVSINRTVIRLGPDRLETFNTPLPPTCFRSIDRAEIRQIFCREEIGKDSYDNIVRRYALCAELTGGRQVPLLGEALPNSWQALYLVRELQNRLELPTVEVANAYLGPADKSDVPALVYR